MFFHHHHHHGFFHHHHHHFGFFPFYWIFGGLTGLLPLMLFFALIGSCSMC